MKKLSIASLLIASTLLFSFNNPAPSDMTGIYKGKEKCNMGRNKNQWSNRYEMTIKNNGANYTVIGLYYQKNPIPATLVNDTLKFDSRKEKNDDIKLWGFGVMNGAQLTIEYKSKVQTGPNRETDYIINECTAIFDKN